MKQPQIDLKVFELTEEGPKEVTPNPEVVNAIIKKLVRSLASLVEEAIAVVEAAEAGEVCPRCGVVHGEEKEVIKSDYTVAPGTHIDAFIKRFQEMTSASKWSEEEEGWDLPDLLLREEAEESQAAKCDAELQAEMKLLKAQMLKETLVKTTIPSAAATTPPFSSSSLLKTKETETNVDAHLQD
jgi:hypothetical protein